LAGDGRDGVTNLRILHFWKSDFLGGGGGAIAMNRLHNGLRREGIDSKILCVNRTVDSPHSIRWRKTRGVRLVESRLRPIFSRMGLNDLHAVGSYRLASHPAFLDADVVHFHGIHGGFFNFRALAGLTRRKPAVFTLHDMWMYTGHCAYSFDCKRWKTGCGRCPYPDTYPKIQRDATALEWRLKDRTYARSRMTVVPLSTAMAAEVEESMLRRFPSVTIPNGVDTEVFEPLDPAVCRDVLGLPPNRRVLMFAAIRLEDHRKGGDLLVAALRSLPPALRENMVLLTLGNGGTAIGDAAGLPTVGLGYVANDRLKAIAYSAADLFVTPSRGETFGLVVLESLACGTPVAAFSVGGVTDLVIPGESGHLAPPEDALAMARGIEELMASPASRERIAKAGRRLAETRFSLDRQVARHISLYRGLLDA
jgi:glycosyltransferase involved in cell wall biosynthesis